jgi:hypothetical protein
MKHLLAATAFSVPVVAWAGTMGETEHVVDIEYWGTSIEQAGIGIPQPGWVPIEEFLHGTIRIRPSLAPPDTFPDLPYYGAYTWRDTCETGTTCPAAPSRFVTTPLQKFDGALSGDTVLIADSNGLPDSFDELFVKNWEATTVGDGPFGPEFVEREMYLQIHGADAGDFIRGDGLWQTFDVSFPGGVGSGGGTETYQGTDLTQPWTWPYRVFSFVVNRIKVTPRVCRIG